MPRSREDMLERARERIARIRAALIAMESLCSGTLLRRTKVCDKLSVFLYEVEIAGRADHTAE